LDPRLINIIREPLYSTEPIQDWEAKSAFLQSQLALESGRASVAGFFEEYRGRKECNYLVSEAKFSDIERLLDVLSELMSKERDWSNLAKTIYFTQAFATEHKGKLRTYAQKYIMSTVLKEPELWTHLLTAFLNVGIFEAGRTLPQTQFG